MIIMQPKKILLAAAWIACLTIAAYILAQVADIVMSRTFDAAVSMVPVIATTPPEKDAALTPRHNTQDKSRSAAGQKMDAGCGVKIEQVSDTRWVLNKASFPATTRDLNRLLMQARAVPFMKQGRIVGFRITRISRGSLYEKAGLRSGDVLLRANAKKLDNPSKLFSIYQEMKRQQRISILLSRNGQNQTFDYEIR